MLARKCDRCGELYEHYETYQKNEEKFNAVVTMDRDINDARRSRIARDLCPKCRLKLIGWLKGEEHE